MSATQLAPQGTYLAELLANPIAFTQPTTNAALGNPYGTVEVVPGPPSPRRRSSVLSSANASASASSHSHSNANASSNSHSHSHSHSPSKQSRQTTTPTSQPLSSQQQEQPRVATPGPSQPQPQPQPSPSPSPFGASTSRVQLGPALPPTAKASTSQLPSQPQSQSQSQSQPQSQSPLQSPSQSRKGKEPQSQSQSLHSAELDLSWPSPIATRKAPAAGLQNPSMACYANATLQVLLHTPPVLRMAMGHEGGDCLQARKGFCMLCELHDLVVQKHWKGQRSYMPSSIHRNLGQIKKGFNRNRQEDAHEFFRFVTDALQNTALARYPKDTPAKLKQTSWVYKLWGGSVRSRVVCSRCQKPSDTFDDFLDLSLDVNHKDKSLLGMLKGFIREDKLEGDNKYHCENCKSKAVATKSFKIQHAPPVLTFHLKRFSVNYGYGGRARADKFNQHIDFGEWLDIAPYMVDKTKGGTKYRLFAVTCHRGVELRFGHYTSYVKGPQGAWFNADDDEMSAVSLAAVLQDKTAYLLSYMRVDDAEYGKKPHTPFSTPSSARPNVPAPASTPTPTRPTTNGANTPLSAATSGEPAHATPPNTSTTAPSMIGPQLPRPMSPTKRKREDASRSPERHPAKFSRNGFITTPLARPSPSPSPSSPSAANTPASGTDAEPPSRFTYLGHSYSPARVNGSGSERRVLQHPRPREFDARSSPIARPGHPSPGGKAHRKKDKRDKDKDRKHGHGHREHRGPPMPFSQGRASGAGGGGGGGGGSGGGGGRSWGGKPNGIVKSMKARRPFDKQ